MKKILLSVSLLLNVIFAIYLLMLKTVPLSEPEERLTHVPQFDASLVQNGEDVSILYELQSKYLPRMTAPAAQYWKRGADVILDMTAEKTRIDQQIRSELLAIYGESAKAVAAFEQYFYPLGPGYEFLNSDVQIEVARIQDTHKTAMLNLSDAGLQSLGQARQLEADYWMQLEQLLTPEQLFEYALRESGLAQQMRTMQFDWSEDEFREVYKIRSEQGPQCQSSQSTKRAEYL